MKAPPVQQPYIPQLGITYPADPDVHMLNTPALVDLILDEHYPFFDRSPLFWLRSAIIYLGIFFLVFPLSLLRFGLRIEGRNILRKHRRLFSKGAVTVSNHMLRWDFLMILKAVRYRRLYFPAWAENFMGPERNLIRLVGGIPVPRDIHVIRYFNQAFDELHSRKKWLHVFPESANWHYFQAVRPFKIGMFTMAYKYNLPVIPMAFSYREPRGIRRLFGGKPLITLRIGEPILPDTSKRRKEAAQLLREQTHRKIVELAGIDGNPYPCEGD
jgi:1-acyl-sn-glycerol-3-phosphate acyltransferase